MGNLTLRNTFQDEIYTVYCILYTPVYDKATTRLHPYLPNTPVHVNCEHVTRLIRLHQHWSINSLVTRLTHAKHFFSFCRDAVSLGREEDDKNNKGLRNVFCLKSTCNKKNKNFLTKCFCDFFFLGSSFSLPGRDISVS